MSVVKKKKKKRLIDITPFTQSLTITYSSRKKNTDEPYTLRKMATTLKGTKKQIEEGFNTLLEEFIIGLEEDYDDLMRNYEGSIDTDIKRGNFIRQEGDIFSSQNVLLQYAGAYKLDDAFIGDDAWDLKANTCVFDYLYYTYKSVKGLIKIMKPDRKTAYNTLNELFNEYYHTEEQEHYDKHYDALRHGVSCRQIEHFAKTYKLAFYAFDKNHMSILKVSREQNDKPAIICIVSNKHFYPITDKTYRNRLVKSTVARERDATDWKSNQVKSHQKGKKEKASVKTNTFATNTIGNEFVMELIEKHGTIPKIISTERNLIRMCSIGNERFITRHKETIDIAIEEFCERNKTEYPWITLHSLLYTLMEEHEGSRLLKINSKMNPVCYDILHTEGVKKRMHTGAVRGNETIDHSSLTGYDINKAFTSVLYDPMGDWLVYDNDDTVEDFDGILRHGLFFVETDDLTVLHQSNWYSNTIIEYALQNKIKLEVKLQYIPKYTDKTILKSNKHYIKEFMDFVMKKVEGMEHGELLYKRLFNTMSGLFGMDTSKIRKVEIDSDVNEVWRCLMEKQEDDRRGIICDNLTCDLEQPLYLYGYETECKSVENHLPIYIQMLDFHNINLHKIQQEVGGECVYRKTDFILMKNCKQGLRREGWGGFKQEKPSYLDLTRIQNENRHLQTPSINNTWRQYTDLTDSSDADKIVELAIREKGLFINGRAGTGKSYVITNNKYMTEENTARIAFTNMAAKNIGGQTIHKLLGLNEELKMSYKGLNKYKKLKFIVVDEIGMVSQELLHLLHVVKKRNEHITFILCGDVRQLGAIEPNRTQQTDIQRLPLIRYLAHNTLVELTVMKRYDIDLWDYLERGLKQPWELLPWKKLKASDFIENNAICVYNKTRKRVNNDVMMKLKPDDAVYFPCNKKSEVLADALYLYVGLKLMSYKTRGEYDLINGSRFIVVKVCNEDFTVKDVDTEVEIKIPNTEIHNLFVVNYITTTHKSQGATYKNEVYLFDMIALLSDNRVYYTAVSRATALDKLFMGTI